MFGNRMKHCLVFASLISPSKMILFEKKYQTFDTVFHHQMKHCVSCLIYYLNTVWNVWKYFWGVFHLISTTHFHINYLWVWECYVRTMLPANTHIRNFHIWKTKTRKKSNQSITVKDVTYFHGSFLYWRI